MSKESAQFFYRAVLANVIHFFHIAFGNSHHNTQIRKEMLNKHVKFRYWTKFENNVLKAALQDSFESCNIYTQFRSPDTNTKFNSSLTIL